MRFYEFENEWSEFRGVWCSKEQPDNKWDCSLEVAEMDLHVSSSCVGEDDFEFSCEICDDISNSWYIAVTIPDDEKFGTPECCTWKVYYTPTMEFMGYVDVDRRHGNLTENVLLGFYDLVEAYCQDKKLFGITC